MPDLLIINQTISVFAAAAGKIPAVQTLTSTANTAGKLTTTQTLTSTANVAGKNPAVQTIACIANAAGKINAAQTLTSSASAVGKTPVEQTLTSTAKGVGKTPVAQTLTPRGAFSQYPILAKQQLYLLQPFWKNYIGTAPDKIDADSKVSDAENKINIAYGFLNNSIESMSGDLLLQAKMAFTDAVDSIKTANLSIKKLKQNQENELIRLSGEGFDLDLLR